MAQLRLGRGLGEEVVDAGLGGDRAAVSGLSPVIITVRMPMRRSSAKRSLMPPFTMSLSWTTPSTRPPSATTSGVAPCLATSSTALRTSAGKAAALLLDEALDGVGRALADLAAVEVDAAHARLRA